MMVYPENNFALCAFAQRIGGKDFETSTAGYKFAAIKKMKAEARLRHPELPLIDLGVGPEPFIVTFRFLGPMDALEQIMGYLF